ncbi:sulfite exporter TauE/SafE family protein [Candidatus Uabimicrobium sp. HlEnr_7]|uniref:sulfite exporter TauE/SafE family protein n=1 Tax=Candidatus Uabimicrobium helgolandensis TaxID=3095367 RepID=UPI0035586F2F
MIFSSIVFGFIIGFLPGLMGGGGSIMSVPIFIYVMTFSVKSSICMSLVVVGSTSFIGGIRYWKLDCIHFRIVFIFGTVAMIATYGGAQISHYLSDGLQLVLFSITTLFASYFMFTSKATTNRHTKDSLLKLVISGAFVGTLSGLVGVGGGFLIVPTLVLFAKLPMKDAIGTSLFIISMNCTAGVFGYIDKVDIAWDVTLLFTLFATIGIFISTHLVKYISAQHLKKSFAVFVFAMGIVIFLTSVL